jgi:hypothetical protein
MVRIAERAEPRPDACARHDQVYGVYRALHPATADLQHRLADIGDERTGSPTLGRSGNAS